MTGRNVVPCNGCTACCRGQRVILSPEHDDMAQYDAVPTRKSLDGPLVWMLRHKPDGDCIYLGADGCTIYGRAPWICRQFDCRQWYLSFPAALRPRLAGDLDGAVVAAARARLQE